MKTLFQYLNESFQKDRAAGVRNTGKRTKDDEKSNAGSSKFKYFKNRGWEIDPSIHAASQAKDRRPEMSVDDWKKLHRSVIAALPKKPKGGDYLFYSKKQEQGYVASVNAKKRRIRVITVLPKGKHNPKGGAGGGTNLMMVESEEYGYEEYFFDHYIEID